jgi:hypothetical protein
LGKGLDLLFGGLEEDIRETAHHEDREMLEFAKKLRRSKGFRAFSDATKSRVELYIKAYEGDEEALLNLSAMVLGVELPGKLDS